MRAESWRLRSSAARERRALCRATAASAAIWPTSRLSSARERPVALLLGQLEHAEHLVAVDDGRPDGRPLAPVLHGLEAGRGRVDVVVRVGDEDLAVLDDAREPGGVGQRVHLADPVDVVLREDAATRAPGRAGRCARRGTRRRSTPSSRAPWRSARRARRACRRGPRSPLALVMDERVGSAVARRCLPSSASPRRCWYRRPDVRS